MQIIKDWIAASLLDSSEMAVLSLISDWTCVSKCNSIDYDEGIHIEALGLDLQLQGRDKQTDLQAGQDLFVCYNQK